MKTRYFITVLMAMLLISGSTMAQKGKKNFKCANLKGVWQMCFYASESPELPAELRPGNTFKLLSEDGYIINFTVIPNKGAVMTGYGKYRQVAENVYHESIERSIHLPMLNNAVNALEFEIKEDKYLQLKFYIEKDEYGNVIDTWYHEVWTRVEMPEEYPDGLIR